jgi:hypothetical protein
MYSPAQFLIIIIFGLCACVYYTKALDLTLVSKSSGPEVVESVVNLIRESCIFADGKRFLRQMAYVESHDGTDRKIFRDGYYGWIVV